MAGLGGQRLAHRARDLRDRLGDDRELHRVELAAVAGRAEHQLDDVREVALAVAGDEREVGRRDARDGGDDLRVDANRALALRALRIAGGDGAPGERTQDARRRGEHRVGHGSQAVGHVTPRSRRRG